MAQSRMEMVLIESIDANPHRQIDKYPFIERKIEALMRSYTEVGMWEGIIARQNGNRYEIAFGHHRLEAARRSVIGALPVIVRELTDAQMLQFMGRENMEDYNADFLAMLETWEAAVRFVRRAGQKGEPIEIASILGWTNIHVQREIPQLSDTARACYAAHALILAGYLDRGILADTTVRAGRAVVERAQTRMEQLNEMATQGKRPTAELEAAKTQVAKAVKKTFVQSNAGKVALKDLASQVDINAYQFARKAKKQTPLFALFGKTLASSLAKLLKDDANSVKLEQVCTSVAEVTLDDDKQIVKRLDFELGALGERAEIWRKRITLTEKKVTRLQLSHNGGDVK